jgi:DNA invertase Pin-like site-specific DNA recombinase
VSTSQQGESGLGLAAQKDVAMRFIGSTPLLAEFTEVESGRRHRNRPQLRAALALCKKTKAKLAIARLDRLSRNVAFVSSLMESGVDFICCDNPHASPLILHVLAAFAQYEREQISERVKVALARVKNEIAEKGFRITLGGGRITRLGGPQPLKALALANAARNLRPPAPQALLLMTQLREAGKSYRFIAATLNTRDIRTPQGFRWYARRSSGTHMCGLV